MQNSHTYVYLEISNMHNLTISVTDKCIYVCMVVVITTGNLYTTDFIFTTFYDTVYAATGASNFDVAAGLLAPLNHIYNCQWPTKKSIHLRLPAHAQMKTLVTLCVVTHVCKGGGGLLFWRLCWRMQVAKWWKNNVCFVWISKRMPTPIVADNVTATQKVTCEYLLANENWKCTRW